MCQQYLHLILVIYLQLTTIYEQANHSLPGTFRSNINKRYPKINGLMNHDRFRFPKSRIFLALSHIMLVDLMC